MAAERPARASFEAVLEGHRGKIRRHIESLVRNRADAEDLTQETFLRAHGQLERLKEPAALGVWLYRIATNVSYDFLRRASRRSAVEAGELDDKGDGARGPAVPDGTPRLDQLVEQAEMSACVQEFLERLPDGYRTAILLHDLQGLTSVEIAELLGCTPGTVKIRLHRARVRLKAALKARCDFSHDERGVLVCGRKPLKG